MAQEHLQYHPINIPLAIHQSLDSFVHDEPWWTNPLVLALNEAERGLALNWVVRCVKRLVALSDSSSVAELLNDIERLDQLASQPLSAQDIGEQAREIWYRADRDTAQTAVSKLYEAFAVHLAASDRHHHLALGAPICIFMRGCGEELGNDRASEIRNIAIDIFIEVANEWNAAQESDRSASQC